MDEPRLAPDDQAWLESYRAAIAARYGRLVDRMILFGSKARGDATDESDLDLLVVIQDGDWRLKSAVADAAYELAIGTDVVPSVKIYTRAEWERLGETESTFREAVTREGVLVA